MKNPNTCFFFSAVVFVFCLIAAVWTIRSHEFSAQMSFEKYFPFDDKKKTKTNPYKTSHARHQKSLIRH